MIIHKETKLEHPLAKFIFCPVCGAKSFAPHTSKANKCSTCTFEYFSNCASSVAVFIENKKMNYWFVEDQKNLIKILLTFREDL
jgi:NADH pyrophosphatase NudC (nudix superfamily)